MLEIHEKSFPTNEFKWTLYRIELLPSMSNICNITGHVTSQGSQKRTNWPHPKAPFFSGYHKVSLLKLCVANFNTGSGMM